MSGSTSTSTFPSPPTPEWLRMITSTSHVDAVAALTGGASRHTYRFRADGRSMIVQRQRQGSDRSLVAESHLVELARSHGVPAPERVASGTDDDGLEYHVALVVAGETIARKILRDERFAGARAALTSQLGAALGALSTVDPDDAPELDRIDQLDRFREVADELDVVNPVFELAFARLREERPDRSQSASIVHGDFRLGNVIVDERGLAAVIDWELAHLGDPVEDLAWLCAPAWRFGGSRPVAGVGEYEELLDSYAAVSGRTVDRETLTWWRILATLKWGIMCVQQARTHLDGVARSHELAAIGRRVCQTEDDLLRELNDVTDVLP